MEEKKAPASPAGEDKAATASTAGLGDDAAGANPFDFSAMSGLLNVRHLYCIWIFIYSIFRSIIGLVFWGIHLISLSCLRIVL